MKRSRLAFVFAFSLIGLFPAVSYSQQAKVLAFYVATNGSPGNPGTLSAPFPSPDEALNAIAKIPGPLLAWVYIRAGNYNFSKSLTIPSTGPDTSRHISISNYKSEIVTFTGSMRLKNGHFRPVTDPVITNRLPDEAKGKVYQISLKAEGITDYGKSLPHGYKKSVPANLELFYNGEPLTLARWPNDGLAPIGTVLDPGSNLRNGEKDARGAKFSFTDSRINGWKDAHNAWAGGFFSYGYSDDYLRVDTFDAVNKTIRLKDPAEYSVFASSNTSTAALKNAQALRGFYVYNLLEEIDMPGEWYMDDGSGILYLWPPDNTINTADIEVSLLEDPIMVLTHTANITIQGIVFGYSRGMGLLADGTVNTTISHCTFSDLGTIGISTGYHVPFNTNLLIQACSIFNTGTGGIIMNGGDRKKLIPANNTVSNCEIFNYSRIDKTFSPAININGVGNHINHCYIHDAPDLAILYYGNDHDISYNHIKSVATNVTDAGAVCTGRDLSSTGTVIGYNYFENIMNSSNSSACAVYLDDGSDGMQVNSNVFYRCGTSGTYHFGAIHVNGGSDNYFRNNYFIDCYQAFSNTQWTDQQYRSLVTDPANTRRIYSDVDIRSDVYSRKYPQLGRLSDSVNLAARQNYSFNTLAYGVTVFSQGGSYVHKNVYSCTQDPGFANAQNGNFNLVRFPPVLQQSGDWKPIPFAEIGPQKGMIPL